MCEITVTIAKAAKGSQQAAQASDHILNWRIIQLCGDGKTPFMRKKYSDFSRQNKHKRLSLWVNMEIGQCSARGPLRHFNYEQKMRQSREDDFFCLFLLLMWVTMTSGHVLEGNESDMLGFVWWKYNEGQVILALFLVCSAPNEWGFIHNTFMLQVSVKSCVWCYKRKFILMLDKFI